MTDLDPDDPNIRAHVGTPRNGLTASPVQRAQVPTAWKLLAASGPVMASLALLVGVVLYVSLQDQRFYVLRTSCETTNERHDDVLAELDARILALTGPERARAERNKAGTVALLEAMVPKVDDCAAYARRRVTLP